MALFPDLIKNLPEADIAFPGIRGWISQSEGHQVVFMEIDAIGEVAEHSHGAQWGVVIKGEMELTIGSQTRTYRKGDSYFIPSGVPHSAVFWQKTYVIDFFADKERYKEKK
jgi:quercetin dioxygenase-like cupin family protein